MKHTCHARNCNVETKPEMLMCLRHWRMVPKKIQRQVWATYRNGQCDDKQPSRRWQIASDAAIGAVLKREFKGRALTKVEVDEVIEWAIERDKKLNRLARTGKK